MNVLRPPMTTINSTLLDVDPSRTHQRSLLCFPLVSLLLDLLAAFLQTEGDAHD